MRGYGKKILGLLSARTFWLWFFASLASIYILSFVGFIIVASLDKGMHFDGYAADGPFQLYNPLRRLADGQVPGVDFPFFHGLGVALIHYPIYWLLGSNVFASEASRWLVSPILFLLSSGVFFYAILRSWRKSLIATSFALIISILYIDVIYPSNSLIGIRTTFPILAAAALMWPSNKLLSVSGWKFGYRQLIAILCLALAFLCGTEQGLAAIGAYLVLRAYDTIRAKTKGRELARVGLELCLLIALTILIFTIVSLGKPWPALHYSLIDVPQEQGWYFGSPPNMFITWQNILPVLALKGMYPVYIIVTAALALLVASRRFKLLPPDAQRAGVFLIIYGFLTYASILGYFAPTGQSIPLMRGALLIGIAVLTALFFHEKLWKLAGRSSLDRRLIGSVTVLVLLGSGLYAAGILASWINKTVVVTRSFEVRGTLHAAKASRNESDFYSASGDWKYRLQSFSEEISAQSSIWSTYASLYESEAGIFHPSSNGRDYIIHALGKTDREKYVTEFKRTQPDYVITVKPSYFPYEEWLWSKAWPFYSHLMSNYQLVKENGSHFLWKRVAAKPTHGQWLKVAPKNDTYSLPGATDQMKLYEVKVAYQASSGLGLKSIDNIPRYLLHPQGTALQYGVTLPPYLREWSFIVAVAPGQSEPSLRPSAEGIVPSARLKIDSLQYRELLPSIENTLPFTNNYCNNQILLHEKSCAQLPDLSSPYIYSVAEAGSDRGNDD